MNFLPENTIVWIEDDELCKERLTDCEEDLQSFLRMVEEIKAQGTSNKVPGVRSRLQEEEDDKLIKKDISADDFTSAIDFEQKLIQRHVVGFGHSDTLPEFYSPFTLRFHTKEQPAFNRQFDLLIKDLKNLEAKGFQCLPVCRKPKTIRKIANHF